MNIRYAKYKQKQESHRKSVIQLTIFISSFLVFYLLLSNLYQTISSPVGWDQQIKVTDSDLNIISYHSAQQGSLTSVGIFGELEEKKGIFTVLSYNKGETFFPPRFLAEAASSEFSEKLQPRTAISKEGRISIIWQDFSPEDSSYHLYLTQSNNKGKNFSDAVMLELGHDMELLPVIFYDDLERLHIIYHALSGDNIRIYHTVKIEDEFTEATVISLEESRIRGAFFPAVINNGANIYVVWQGKESSETLNDDLYFVKTEDYGREWTVPVRITLSEDNDNAPALTIVGQTLYLVYLNNEQANWELHFIRGLNFGDVWEEQPVKVFSTNVNCLSPHLIAKEEDYLQLFWYQNTGAANSIMTCDYYIPENVFSRPIRLSEDEKNAANPSSINGDQSLISLWVQEGSLYTKKTDTYAAPPSVISETHPFGEWSQYPRAEIRWTPPSDDSGIAGYATIVNREKYFDPTVQNIESSTLSTSVPFLPDGISYFHIRTIDKAGNYSRTIHFPLLVSSNPLSIPQLQSSTHEEGKSSEVRNAKFSWTQDGEERVDGFYYSFNPGKASIPEKYTDEKSLSFNNLKDGRYFLTLRAVDKTGNEGRIATFELLVGDVESIDAEEYEKMAQNMEQEDQQKSERVTDQDERIAVYSSEEEDGVEEKTTPAIEIPTQEIVLLFDEDNIDDTILGFTLQFKNETPESITDTYFTYSIFKDGVFFLSGETKDGIVSLKDMQDGEYSVQAHGIYSYLIGDETFEGSTETVSDSYQIKTFYNVPVDKFYTTLIKTFSVDWRINTVFIASLTFALMFSVGFSVSIIPQGSF
jgi:hypothetical protein